MTAIAKTGIIFSNVGIFIPIYGIVKMSEQNEKEGAVGSLERGLLIIRVLLDAPGPMSLAELAQELALGPSTVHRLLGTLTKLGQVVREPRGKRYLAAPQVLASLSFQHPITLVRLACRSAIEELRERTGETSAFVLFIGYERLVQDFVIGQRLLSPNYQTWLRSPMHGSASGKLLLSTVPENNWVDLIGHEPYQAHTPSTITTYEEMVAEIQAIRRQHYCVSKNEGYEGVSAFGYPVVVLGKTVGCITLTVDSASLNESREAFLIQEMLRCVKSIQAVSGSLKLLHDWLF
ncbi:IclR family transcriptional regulator [Bordetella bronchiseptica]